MLGLLLLYWIGKYYYRLAEEHNKNPWGFVVLGIVTYYAGTFIFGFLIGGVIEIMVPGYVDTMNELLAGLVTVPFGILSTYILYDHLKKSWEKNSSEKVIDPTEVEEETVSANRLNP